MADIKWAAFASQGTVLAGTDTNAQATATYVTAASVTLDNTTNKHTSLVLELNFATTLTPTGTASYTIFLTKSADGTTYESVPSATNDGRHILQVTVSVNAGAGTRRVVSGEVPIGPFKYKAVGYSTLGVSVPSDNNFTVTAYTGYQTVA